jgi:hypothetical protein
MVLTIAYDHEARKRSYELIAEELGLGVVSAGELAGERRAAGGRSTE